MKTSFLVTLLLAAAVSTHCIEQVKDSNGNPVKLGGKYFIQPVKTDSNDGGGLVPDLVNIDLPCPLGIVHTLLPYKPGMPVIFGYDPVRVNTDYIYTSTSINIKFESDVWPVCDDPDYTRLWAVQIYPSLAKEPAIIVGDKAGNRNSRFKIEEATGTHTYKLTTSYGTVGTIPGVWQSNPQLLATNDEAKTLFVQFVNVTTRVEKLGLRMLPFYY